MHAELVARDVAGQAVVIRQPQRPLDGLDVDHGAVRPGRLGQRVDDLPRLLGQRPRGVLPLGAGVNLDEVRVDPSGEDLLGGVGEGGYAWRQAAYVAPDPRFEVGLHDDGRRGHQHLACASARPIGARAAMLRVTYSTYLAYTTSVVTR